MRPKGINVKQKYKKTLKKLCHIKKKFYLCNRLGLKRALKPPALTGKISKAHSSIG